MQRDFVDMLRALEEAEADFLIVGAHALAVHGVPRATGDLDVWIRPGETNAEKVMRALSIFGAPVAAHGVVAADLVEPGNVYQIGLPPRRIDLLSSISGVSFDRAWQSRVEIEVEGMKVSFLGRDCLLANKRATARPKDLADIELLLRQAE